MTCEVGPRVARVASPFYYFLKFLKKSVSVGYRTGIYPSNPSNPRSKPVYFKPWDANPLFFVLL